MTKRADAESRLHDTREKKKIFCTRGPHEIQAICPDAMGVPCSAPAEDLIDEGNLLAVARGIHDAHVPPNLRGFDATSRFLANEGTEGLWLPEDRILKLTSLEVGWMWAIMRQLDETRGEMWPTAEPDADGKPIPSTMPRRIYHKLLELMK